MKGIKKVDFEGKDFVVVTFDDDVIAMDKIINELGKKGNQVKDKPVYLK